MEVSEQSFIFCKNSNFSWIADNLIFIIYCGMLFAAWIWFHVSIKIFFKIINNNYYELIYDF